MIDQEMECPVAGRLGTVECTARPIDAGSTITAIIAITRREWMPQGNAPPAIGEAAVNGPRFAHPLIRFALDARRSNAWRARRFAGADAISGMECRFGSRAEDRLLELDSD